MLRRSLFGVIAAAAIAFSTGAFAGDFGTAEEAKALLGKAVTAVKADEKKAFDMFNKGDGGFKDRDLYVFCANASDDTINAGPASVIGKKLTDLKDKTGKAFGAEMKKVATEGSLAEVSYMWPRPGADSTPVQKVSFVTKVADQICGVGYYKP